MAPVIDHQAIRFLGDIPAAQARAMGDRIALQFEDRQITYAELHRRSVEAARVLSALGVGVGDRVAWLSRNTELFFEVFFGITALRACLAPINFRLAPAEIAFILGDNQANVLFVSDEFYDMARTIASEIGRPIRLISLGPAADGPSYPMLRDAAEGAAPDAQVAQDEDDVLQLYTSGTTGLPKGVRLTNANYACFLEVGPKIDGFNYARDEVVLIVMPLFHVAGTNVSFAGLAHGCRVIILADFVPARVLDLMQRQNVAHMFAAPSMIQMLLQAPEAERAGFPALRSIAYGASPISEAVLSAAKTRFGCDFVQFYGMTESTGAGSFLSPSAHTPDKLRSCGLPWPGVEVKVCGTDGPTGPEAAAGEVGEIAIRGAAVMKGYWNRPEATAATIVGGWLLTGDAGYRDAAGYLYMHDRVKDMIVTGGENVYPAEVENAIFGCPGVADVAVIGVPSDRWGEEVKALVVAHVGDRIEPAQIIAWARARVAGYKTPKSVEFVDTLPRNASGKVLRRELRARYWQGRDRAVG
jgi:acyl-CoA synthetase (AMP-forming)/AMP-acid ligase II